MIIVIFNASRRLVGGGEVAVGHGDEIWCASRVIGVDAKDRALLRLLPQAPRFVVRRLSMPGVESKLKRCELVAG